MRVLWFEVTEPKGFNELKNPIAGWQDSLQEIITKNSKDINLAIAFESQSSDKKITKDGVTYYPIKIEMSYFEKLKSKTSWDISISKIIRKCEDIIKDFRPDIIHVFGSEWCFGLVAKYTDIPVVIHMQGSIPPYNNAMYPPNYSIRDLYASCNINFKKRLNLWLTHKKDKSREKMEEEILQSVNYYMGRTTWDYNIVKLYNPTSIYYTCHEALRTTFTHSLAEWSYPNNHKLKIITTGTSTFWKGLDTILKTANKLRQNKIEFEWFLVGGTDKRIIKTIEKKERLKFEENNIYFTGYLGPEQLLEMLLSSNVYVHTAYIDNSPNSICEAQYIGMPVIATYVGGIPSIVENGVSGLLVPANDPFSLSANIIDLYNNPQKFIELGKNAKKIARDRHDSMSIYCSLINCYNSISKQ